MNFVRANPDQVRTNNEQKIAIHITENHNHEQYEMFFSFLPSPFELEIHNLFKAWPRFQIYIAVQVRS